MKLLLSCLKTWMFFISISARGLFVYFLKLGTHLTTVRPIMNVIWYLRLIIPKRARDSCIQSVFTVPVYNMLQLMETVCMCVRFSLRMFQLVINCVPSIRVCWRLENKSLEIYSKSAFSLRKKVQKLSLGRYLFKKYTFVPKGCILVH